MIQRIIFLFGIFLQISGFGQTDCTYSDASISEAFLKTSNNVSAYSWDNKSKEGRAILVDGGVFHIKKWACTHYGLTANLMVSKDLNVISNWKGYVQQIGELMDDESANNLLKSKIRSIEDLNIYRKSNAAFEVDLSNNVYPEFYLNIYELPGCFVFSVSHYKM